VPSKRQAVKCIGKRRDGSSCQAYAIIGGVVCRSHGGLLPRIRASARQNMISTQAERLLYRHDASPCTDALDALQRLAGRALALEETIGHLVNDLTSIRYEGAGEAGAEQLRAEVVVMERAMDRCGRLLVDLAKLNIEERLVKISEGQADLIEKALKAALAEMGLDLDEQDRAARSVARHLRAA
jgi:hypothetical protein